jgi:uncharacterized protein YyaL (SSP411 family)
MLTMRFGLDRPANFEGKWHLHAWETEVDVAKAFDVDTRSCHETLYRQREALLSRRQQRIPPGRDDKVLTSWNALMISGLAHTGRHLRHPLCIESAARATAFIRSTLWRDGKLMATTRNGHTHLNAYLDDYAFMLQALLELLQCRWDSGWLGWAIELADAMLDSFEDKENGGFFFTSHDHEQLIQRSKTFADDSIPSGNGVAALALQRLGYITGNSDYLDAAENTLKCAQPQVNHHAISHCSILHALDEHLNAPGIIILRGDEDQLEQCMTLAAGRYLPVTMILPIPTDADLAEFDFLAEKIGQSTCSAYLCEGRTCQPPAEGIEAIRQLFDRLTMRIDELTAEPENNSVQN